MNESPIKVGVVTDQTGPLSVLGIANANIAAQMVPGQHHVRLNMYIAQVKNGALNVVKSVGAVDPKECVQGVK